MSSELREALERLEDRLRANGASVVDRFRPGLDPEYVRQTLAAEGITAHDDVVTWWGWHSGADHDDPRLRGRDMRGPVLISPWHFPRLEHAVQSRRSMHRTVKELIRSFPDAAEYAARLVPESWLPLMGTSGGGELCIETAASGPAPLYIQEFGMSGPAVPHFESLLEFVGLLIRVLDEGLTTRLSASDGGGLSVDFPRLPQELRRLAIWAL